MRFAFALAAVVIAGWTGVGAAQAPAPNFTPREEAPEDFVEGEGRDVAVVICGGCHGFKLVAQQGQTRRQWGDTVDFMVTRYNMAELDPDTRKIVLDYLEAAYPPRTSPRGFQNPFLPR